MAFTYLGCRFARNIKRGYITLADVPTAFIHDTRDSYKELFGTDIPEDF